MIIAAAMALAGPARMQALAKAGATGDGAPVRRDQRLPPEISGPFRFFDFSDRLASPKSIDVLSLDAVCPISAGFVRLTNRPPILWCDTFGTDLKTHLLALDPKSFRVLANRRVGKYTGDDISGQTWPFMAAFSDRALVVSTLDGDRPLGPTAENDQNIPMIRVDPFGRFIYTLYTSEDRIVRFNMATGAIDTFRLECGGLTFAPGVNGDLYVLQGTQNRIAALDRGTMAIKFTVPLVRPKQIDRMGDHELIACDPETGLVYAQNPANDGQILGVYDMFARRSLGSARIDGLLNRLATSPFANRLFLGIGNKIVIFPRRFGPPIGEITTPARIEQILEDDVAHQLYVRSGMFVMRFNERKPVAKKEPPKKIQSGRKRGL